MKNTLHQFFCGKENRLNSLIALSVVSLFVLGCTCSLGNPWQKENSSNLPPNTTSQPTESGKVENTPTPAIAKSPAPTPVKTVEPPPPPANIPQPVEVAYIHFLDEAHRNFGGSMKVGSPKKSGTRIEVRITANGETETLVVMQKSNDGHRATVIAGPKDAGAVRSYTLKMEDDEWKIINVKDLNG